MIGSVVGCGGGGIALSSGFGFPILLMSLIYPSAVEPGPAGDPPNRCRQGTGSCLVARQHSLLRGQEPRATDAGDGR